jgi:hypothetical protein
MGLNQCIRLADHAIACAALLIQRMMAEKSHRHCCMGWVAGCSLNGSRGHYNGRGIMREASVIFPVCEKLRMRLFANHQAG